MNTTHSEPGWLEITTGPATIAIIGVGGGLILARLGMDPVPLGLVLTGWSGIAGMTAFAAAFLIRSRS